MGGKNMIEAFKLAVSFLTIIPVKIKSEPDKAMFAKSVVFYPLVGLIIGVILGLCWQALRLAGTPKPVSAILVVIVSIMLTRMLHLDGLADTYDGLLGGRDANHSLEIMKDSRVGSFGVIVLICAIISKVVFIFSLPDDVALKALVLFPVIGRFAASYSLTTQPFARDNGLGALFKTNANNNKHLIIATILTLSIAIAIFGFTGLLVLAGSLSFAVVFLGWAKQKIGGITGDITGALVEQTEIVVLMTAVFLEHNQPIIP
jgi:adenosylcobinamide-GDP ribazoletransferase